MPTQGEIELLEKTIGQLVNLYYEFAGLSKKSQNDAVNKLKLQYVNKILTQANQILTGSYRPSDDFEKFEEDDVPTNSDVALILGQYIQAIEDLRFRSLRYESGIGDHYVADDTREKIKTGHPRRLIKR